eukprot:UN16087
MESTTEVKNYRNGIDNTNPRR